MEYLINDRILFSPENKKLHSITDESLFVELSNTATRLLIKFIDKNSILLTRDELFKDVWSDYGFTYSYSALSNHVSEIRKAFISLEHDLEVLTTVTGTGFKFDAKIKKQASTVNEIHLPTGNTESRNTKKDTIIEHISMVKSKLDLTMLFFTFTALTLIFTLSYIYLFYKNNEVHFIKSFKKCDIYQIAYSVTLTEAKAINLLNANNINCTNDDIDIFYTESDGDSDEFGIKVISSCRKNDNSCINYVYNNRY
ncbi:winged helix-turn-helix domain-containing protein [[Enterobacter] lignolyticus]|uniref:OmpR/PhoB-type domain-containing protein n=1 Tax=[Enterobacter] lignolyticus TaxID=1334193 RepID=A0A806XCG8_9ENTR|nr:winged helix-turn-helix domain-containing protein [[Enterobacter] lignolyticus]ALR76421.1 hypothetical protein AO703_08970 [[Enterobacter] lignolyticus]